MQIMLESTYLLFFMLESTYLEFFLIRLGIGHFTKI